MMKGTAFMITGLSFAILLSIINLNFSLGCPATGTKIIWASNFTLTVVMLGVFAYGTYLRFSGKKKGHARSHHS